MTILKYIHCNKCFRISSIKDTVYWLASCGHILCQNCLDHSHAARKREEHQKRSNPDSVQAEDSSYGSDGICVLCKKSCEVIQLVENVEDLPEHIQPFFRPFERLCNEAVSTWKFQEQNLTKLIDHLQSKTKRQYEVLVKARTELSNMKAMKVENQALKAENAQLKQQMQELQKQRHADGKGCNVGGGGRGGAPITSVTPQIKVMGPPSDRVQPPTTSRMNPQASREEPAKAVNESGKDSKRARSTTSNVGTNTHPGRANTTPCLAANTGRISLVSHQPALVSPRLTLSRQPNDILLSPRRPPSVHALHQIAQPRYSTTNVLVPQFQGGATLQQGLGHGGQVAVANGQGGNGYQQTPVQALNRSDHLYPTAQQGWSRTELAPPGLPPPPGLGYPGRVVTAAAATQFTGLSYSIVPSAAAGQVSGGAATQDPLICMRGSASAARTTWQQQQQQQQQQQHQLRLQKQQFQRQQRPQEQLQTHQQYGYSAVPHHVFLGPHHG